MYFIKDEQFELSTEVVCSGILLSWFGFVASGSLLAVLGEISKFLALEAISYPLNL